MAEDQQVEGKRATSQISLRVHTDTLEHYKKVAAKRDVPWAQLLRATLTHGFECELGRCPHAGQAARKVRHLEAYIDKYGYMAPPKGFERPSGSSVPVADRVVTEFNPTEEEVAAAGVDTETGEFL